MLMRRVDTLKPCPYRDAASGERLVELMEAEGISAETGIRKPLAIRTDGTIVDGMLRYAAAKLLGFEEVPIHYVGG